MSFITKRERVFNEYELYDLPPRNEGKLKAYASCTDARAWSHFRSDKTEHLVEIIKRNNDACHPKYLPTDVIVDTLLFAKNAEIARLKRKIEEFEQMLATYDQLDLTCDQKCEIAKAHAAIKAANKDLDDLCLDLDLSGFTEGLDSDAFETGKSRGDEAALSKGSESVKSRGDEWNFEKEPPRTEAKSNQTELVCPCDVATSAQDPRIQDMQDTIIGKDAKLSAMQNTIAVMENDVCEPYCIYAHIYTALEKIFGVLCQNDKYKLYLNLMTAGKDTICIDIKGKILYKLKVLEKFSLALIAPCSQQEASGSSLDYACLRAEVVERLDFSLTVTESKIPSLDNKRAQLVADIMANEEMKEILSKESSSEKNEDDQTEYGIDNYSIDSENLKRLKSLQENYDELMTCYEKVKYEKDCLQLRCSKYEELEKEFESLKNQLREYKSLWNEKEHYRKRSLDIDSLKEQYLVLADETSSLETQLKAESEINLMKSNTIEDLRSENILLEKKLNEALIAFEKEKNTLQCKLKETECTVMCQEQQVKSLSVQIDRLLEQGPDKMHSTDDSERSLALIDEIETLKQQIRNLRDSLLCSEEEKQQLHDEFQDKLRIINDLRLEIEDWKSQAQHNAYLKKCTNSFQEEVQRLIDDNKALTRDLEEKSIAVENLRNIIDNRSQEVETLKDKFDKNDIEKKTLQRQFQDLRELYDHSKTTIDTEKIKALQSIYLARRESQELLNKVNDYCSTSPKSDNMSTSAKTRDKDQQKLRTTEQISHLQSPSQENVNSELLQEIQRLRKDNSYILNNIDSLQDEKLEYKNSLDLTKKKSDISENKLLQYESLSKEIESLKYANKNLLREKTKLENDLINKKTEIEQAMQSIQLSKKDSEEIIIKLEHFKNLEEELLNLNRAYKQLMDEKRCLKQELLNKSKELAILCQSLNDQNEDLRKTSKKICELEEELRNIKRDYQGLMTEKNLLHMNLDNQTKEISMLNNSLDSKIKENCELTGKVQSLESSHRTANDNILALQNENVVSQTILNDIRKESTVLIDKLKHFDTLENEFEKLRTKNDSMHGELNRLTAAIRKVEQDNTSLKNENQSLHAINEELENSLIKARNQLIAKPGSPRLNSEDILKEIENMRKEKNHSQNKIKDLVNKLDESDNIISDLREKLLAREDKIAILDNHINELEDEIRRLHENLAKVIDAGEEISTNNSENYDQSMKGLEAHYSKAAHNIKMELAKLKNENVKLEVKLSATKLKTEESNQNKNKYLSQVIHLQNEREIIVTDLKQLEINSVGDSALVPKQCTVDEILGSLERIRKSLNAQNSKSSSLEQTILKVKTSSQLLLNKADEAKKIVEKEKQKIIMENEEVINEKINMEKRLSELKTKLENQIARDEEVIKDLEANMLNQKLMAQNSISKLKSELQEVQLKYRNGTSEIEGLKEKVRNLLEENKKYLEVNAKLNSELKEKIESINKLQDDFKNKIQCDKHVQVKVPIKKNVSSQTETSQNVKKENSFSFVEPDINDKNKNVNKFTRNLPNANIVNRPADTNVTNLLPNQTPPSFNEVQILTANVEPTFDFVRSSYLNYKIQRLSPCKLEHYSISDEQSPEQRSEIQTSNSENYKNYQQIIDIFNASTNSTSSKANENGNVNGSKQVQPTNSSVYTGIALTNDSDETGNNENELKPLMHPSEDVFVIYKDYQNDNSDKKIKEKLTKIALKPPAKSVTNIVGQKSPKENKSNQSKSKPSYTQYNNTQFEDDDGDDDSVKPKLKINLPRVGHESFSMITSEEDKKSIYSSTLSVYPSPNRDISTNIRLFSDTEITKMKKETPCLLTLSNDDIRSGSYNIIRMNSDDGANHFLQHLDKAKLYVNDIQIQHNQQENKNMSDTNEILKITAREKNLSDDDLELLKLNMRSSYNEFEVSQHDLSRVDADVYLINSKKYKESDDPHISSRTTSKHRNFPLNYILDTVERKVDLDDGKLFHLAKDTRKSKSDERLQILKLGETDDSVPSKYSNTKLSSMEYKTITSPSLSGSKIFQSKPFKERIVMPIDEKVKDYEDKIKLLNRSLEITEIDYKKRLEAIKSQYDSNIKNIINEHNQGVKNIQGLHEETLQDIIKIHENEVENLRTMSFEANRKAEKLERENRSLKQNLSTCPDETDEPIKISSDGKKRRRSRYDSKMLTKTNVVACNVKPKTRSQGPCTCSLDVNISDTIRNIFEQVDVEQRKMAEYTYMKYIANKILSGNVESLDAQELSFLHLKVCRIWKIKLSKEEALQKRIDNLESELISRQRHAQQHIAELDRKVEEEKRRLQEVREAVCRNTPSASRAVSPDSDASCVPPVQLANAAEKVCAAGVRGVELSERRSAGDLAQGLVSATLRPKKIRTDTNRAVLAKMDLEEKREKRLYCNDDPPTRLRRSHDRQTRHKK